MDVWGFDATKDDRYQWQEEKAIARKRHWREKG